MGKRLETETFSHDACTRTIATAADSVENANNKKKKTENDTILPAAEVIRLYGRIRDIPVGRGRR